MGVRFWKAALVALSGLVLCGAALAQLSIGREHILPLFVSEANSMPTASGVTQQGFVRIINHSEQIAMVFIFGVDDAGNERGPVMLELGGGRTVHLNSGDLENGNAGKGLPQGLGPAMGHWRLYLHSEYDIEPQAYIRTRPDGFLTAMSAVAPAGGLRHWVSIFNPASNFNQRSWLRLVNLSRNGANVTISGVDDAGMAGARAGEFRLGALEAMAVTAEDLEVGNGFGDGTGKWQLAVISDQPILVMSLLETPTGHLSNLSAAKVDYRGPAGVWKLTFDDGLSEDGYLIATTDSRLYGWLPEMSGNPWVVDGTYGSDAGRLNALGEVYESGEVQSQGAGMRGGSESFELAATYQQGDWMRGSYTVGNGSARAFNGWAVPGFDRGADAAGLAGAWKTSDEDLMFSINAAAEFEGELNLGTLRCSLSGALDGINPAFNLYESNAEADCGLFDLKVILAVGDATNAGGNDHAIALVIARGDAVAIGATATR